MSASISERSREEHTLLSRPEPVGHVHPEPLANPLHSLHTIYGPGLGQATIASAVWETPGDMMLIAECALTTSCSRRLRLGLLL